jgi:hypothetical protein
MATLPEVRQAAFECEVCHVALHHSDAHFPHDRECPRFRLTEVSHLSHRHEAVCSCDHTVCPDHCWECHPQP